jgi:hypothetical protein
LLDELARLLEQDRGDLRAFLQRVITTRLWALDSERDSDEEETDRARQRFFARRNPTALSPSALRHAVLSVLGVAAPARRSSGSPLARQLEVLNGDIIAGLLDRGGHLVDGLAEFGGAPDAQLRDLWLLTLSRAPSDGERDVFLPHLQADEPTRAVRELAFALLASREFGSIR